jgi:hypothetical protein
LGCDVKSPNSSQNAHLPGILNVAPLVDVPTAMWPI